MNRRFLLIISVVASLLVLLAAVYLNQNNRIIKTGVQFYISPSDATIKINDEPIKLEKSLQLEIDPGTYTAQFVRPNFATKTETFNVREGEITQLPVLLIPVNEEGEAFLREESQIRVREEVTYRLALITGDKIVAATPLTQYLPAYNEVFRIDYGLSLKYPEDTTKVSIYITTEGEEQRSAALDWIRSKGYDPEGLEIYYRFY
jgi:hypothetical protein